MSNVYSMSPINKTAAIVSSQKGVTDYSDLTPAELNATREQYLKRRIPLAKELGIVTKAKKRNVMYKAGKHKNFIKNHPKSELMKEYVFMGKQSNRITRYLESIKK